MSHLIDPSMFTETFMQNALLAGTIVAILAGVAGFFVSLRGASFVAHSLAHIGFAGAAGAVLIGIDPLWGLVVFALGGAMSMGALGGGPRHDATTALLLVTALGTGALFLALNDTYATAAFSLLFGTIVGVSRAQVWQTGLFALGCLAGLAAIFRPLLLSSLSPELAAARGVPVGLLHALFLGILAVGASVTVPTVGVLLVFALLVGPAAAAGYLTSSPGKAMLVAMAIALAATWTGITLAYDTGWPVGFFIATISLLAYLAARFTGPRRARSAANDHRKDHHDHLHHDHRLARPLAGGLLRSGCNRRDAGPQPRLSR